MSRVLRILALAFVVAVATMLLQWWIVIVVGALWGFSRRPGLRPLDAGIGAALGWGLLLALVAARGPAGMVAAQVGGVVGVPGPVLVALTLLFPFVLAWSSARVTAALRRGDRTTAGANDEAGRGTIPTARLTSPDAERARAG